MPMAFLPQAVLLLCLAASFARCEPSILGDDGNGATAADGCIALPSGGDPREGCAPSNCAAPKAPKADSFEFFGRPYVGLASGVLVDLFHEEERWLSTRVNSKALLASGITVHCLKWLTNVRRPRPGRHSRWNSSFPSGHSAIAFCRAGALGELHPSLRPPFTLLAVMVARSRVKSRHHRIQDVIVGGAIGFLWGRYFGRLETGDDVTGLSSGAKGGLSLLRLRF